MADRVRASDAEREEYAQILRAAMTEGRLTLEEGEERLTTVYAARFRDELPGLTVDLPGGGRDAVVNAPEAVAERRRAGTRSLRRHTGFVIAAAFVLTGIWALSGAHFFWPVFPLVFLAIGLMKHARYRRWADEQRHLWRHGHAPWGRRGEQVWNR